MTLDEVVPHPQYRMCHSRTVSAPPAAVWDELCGVTMSALPLGYALDAGPDGVALMPGGVLLAGAVADLQLVELARGEAHGALGVAGGGAGGPDRAGLALALGEAATISGAASGEEVG